MAKAIPDGYPQVSPYLCIDGADAAIEFYSNVFAAKERTRMPSPGGKIGHAELQLGDSLIMRGGPVAAKSGGPRGAPAATGVGG